MSASDPRRLVEYGDDLRGVLKNALDAERGAPPAGDAARLRGIEERLAQAIGATAPAEPVRENPPQAPPEPATAAPAGIGAKGALAALASVALLGALAFVATREEPPPAPARDPVVTVAPEKTALAPASAAPTERAPDPVSVDDLPSAATPKAPPKASATAAPATPSEGEEIALLARAQKELRGNPQQALSLCDEHASRYRAGAFGEEREAVAIEALVYLHREGEAQTRFRAFGERWPTSSHRVHLESLFAPSAR